MKVFSVSGLTKSGKTTTVENVIRELKARGYSVGSVKEIHYHAFKMDVEGTNTDRHSKAGAELVTARGMNETDILYPAMLPMDKILSFYDQDYVVLEGVNDINAPRIVTAHDIDGIEQKRDYRTIAISGVIADTMSEYKGLPVIHCINDTKRLVDLIEEKVPELLPDFDPECCGACGYDCHTMLERILSGQSRRSDCVISQTNIDVTVNGKPLKMVPFVQDILRNTMLGILRLLDGYQEGADIRLSIGNRNDD